MANVTAASNKTQEEFASREIGFCDVPVISDKILAVRPGLPLSYIQSHVSCLLNSLRQQALTACDGGMDADAVWLLWVNLDMAMALVDSMELPLRRVGE